MSLENQMTEGQRREDGGADRKSRQAVRTAKYFYFQIFQRQTARELSGYFDSSFYTERVLEACNTEAAIRHAAIALGALQKTLEQPEKNSNSPTDASRAHEEQLRHWQVAVRQYSEACNAMMAMRDPDPISLRTQLMASVLLASFDSFIGDFRQAISQIQSGLDLLERIRFIARLPAYGIATGTPEEELTIIFMRMAIQAKSYDLSFHFPEPYVVRFTSPAQHQARLQRLNQPDRQQALDPNLHDQNPHSLTPGAGSNAPAATPSASLSSSQPFSTVHEARLAHDRLNERLVRFQESLNIRPKERSRMAMPPSWLQEIGFFKEQLVAWALAFEPLFQSRHAPNFTRKERARVSALKLAHLTAKVISAVQFSSSEIVFDDHYGVFQSMVDLVMEFVQEEEAEGAAICQNESAFCHHQRQLPADYISAGVFSPCHIKPTFSMDQGIVAPLFVIATKCRVPVLRRQAIELLKGCGRREGMWDSELTARISHWIMTLEEILPDGLGSEPSPGNVGTPSPYDDRRPKDSAGYYNDLRAFMALSARDAVPAEKRVTLKSVDFDLRARRAVVSVGTRDSPEDLPDLRYRSTRITW
ncbi:C6 zinc finger domain protein [Sarocladium implicatum]|nr:C6 zinc finger domain protein [Sarocladium implicatum]